MANIHYIPPRQTGYKPWPPCEAAKYEDRIILAIPAGIGYVKQFVAWDDIDGYWQIAATMIAIDEKTLAKNPLWNYDTTPNPGDEKSPINTPAEKSKKGETKAQMAAVIPISRGRPKKPIPEKTAEKVRTMFSDGASKAEITRRLRLTRYAVEKVLKAA